MDQAQAQLAEFWNKRAETFPRYNEEPFSYEDSMLDLVRKHGLDIEGKNVLDVGAGSGMYTLKIAREAKTVLALDVSEKMLEISKTDAEKLGLKNITYLKTNWSDFESPQQFDIVFCSMCPGIKDDQSRHKLLDLAGEALIFIGFNDYTDPEPVAQLIKHYGLTRKIFKSGPQMRSWLEEKDIKYSFYTKSGNWIKHYQADQALEWCETILKDLQAADPDRNLIQESLKPFWDKNQYEITTPYCVELIICEKNSFYSQK
jgi:SAM-dependent methyltransferase